VDVDGQRLERGYIDDLDALGECRTGRVGTVEGVDRYEEAGKGPEFARQFIERWDSA